MALTKVPSNLDATVATTQAASDNSTNVATTAYVTTAIANLVDSSPSALNTLNELASALGDDANFASTVNTNLATKLNLSGGTLTGGLGISYTNPILSLTTPWSTGNYGQLRLGYTAGTERSITGHYDDGLKFKVNAHDMVFNTAGNVGIGNTNPGVKLDVTGEVRSTSQVGYRHVAHTIESGHSSAHSTQIGRWPSSGARWLIVPEPEGSPLYSREFGYNFADDKWFVEGNFGIGTINADAKLHVKGNSDNGDSDCELVIQDSDSTSGSQVPAILFKGPGTTIGRIRCNDSLGILISGGTTMSDDLVIQNSGVGIGTSSPDTLLDIEYSASNHTQGIHIANSQAGGYGNAITYISERSDNNSLEVAARIRTEGADSWNSNSSTSSNLVFETVNNNTLAERMRFTTNGTTRFQVDSIANSYLYVKSNDDGSAQAGIQLAGTDDNHSIFFRRGYDGTLNTMDFHQYGGYRFFTNGALASQTEKMAINSSGDIHFNMLSSDFRLRGGVYGSRFDSNPNMNHNIRYHATAGLYFNVGPSNANFVFEQQGTARYTISSSGGANGSDIKLKENVEDINYGLDTVKQLQPRKFDWKGESVPAYEKAGIGFIAQEVESIIPELISEKDHPDDPGDGSKNTKMMNYGAMTSVLVKAIQELEARVKELEG